VRVPGAAILALAACSAAAAAPAGGPAGVQRSPRRSWTGTISFVSTTHVKHTQTAGDSVTQDEIARLTITQDGFQARETASYDFRSVETYFHCNTLSGVKTVVEEGSGSAEVDLLQVALDRQKGRFEISAASANVPTKITSEQHAPGDGKNCGADDSRSTSSGTRLVEITLPMSTTFKPGEQTLGGKAERHDAPSTACSSPGYECSASTTVRWALHRAKALTISKLRLYDRDPHWSSGTAAKEFTPLEYVSASPHPWFKEYGSGGAGATQVELLIDDAEGIVAKAHLADSAHGSLVRSFDSGAAAIQKPELLFVLPSSEAAKLDRAEAENRELTLRVKAVSEYGDEVARAVGRVEQLVRFELGNAHRYGPSGAPSTLDSGRGFASTRVT